jgi:hypothetical protein
MGFLSRLFKSSEPGLVHLPAGSFTLDREGRVMTSTLPRSFPAEHLVLAAFRSAKKAQIPLTEIIIHYAALKLLARELGGGAMVFLMPQSLNSQANAVLKKAP